MMKPFNLAAALAICLAAAPAAAQMPVADPVAGRVQAIPYLATAGEGDVFEIMSSQIAIMRSQNPRVRAFASMLIDHHTRMSNVTLAAAKSAGILPPPPVLGTQHRAMIGQLYSASPADFDRVYIQQQIPAHESALALQSAYASGGDTAQLRTTARSAVPIVTGHLQQARGMTTGM